MFDGFEEEFLKFERVEQKLNQRPDIHAFILLDRLLPDTRDMVAAADHDEIYLQPSPEELRKVATKDQLRDLHRCGVRYDATSESLVMFV